jgi:hypothetical protein
MNTKLAIVRNTFGDRSAFLQLSLEYQNEAELNSKIKSFIFVDPHPINGYSDDFDKVINKKQKRINFEQHQGKLYWYSSIKHMFDNYEYNYILSIADDVIISKDYLKICNQIMEDKVLDNQTIFCFHAGAWDKPKGDKNNIVRSSASSNSILITREKFELVKAFVKENAPNMVDNNHMISEILNSKGMTTIAPEYNRHSHFGIYGYTVSGKHGNLEGQSSLFSKNKSHEDLYELLKKSCLKGKKLASLNKNQNPRYFWDFDPSIDYDLISYSI